MFVIKNVFSFTWYTFSIGLSGYRVNIMPYENKANLTINYFTFKKLFCNYQYNLSFVNKIKMSTELLSLHFHESLSLIICDISIDHEHACINNIDSYLY